MGVQVFMRVNVVLGFFYVNTLGDPIIKFKVGYYTS
jgi:hypothetical protein